MRLNPCVESLKDMKPVEGGRYCGSCAKTIVDLTNKSNQEIRQLYNDHNGHLCGIVNPNQLKENKFYHPLKRFALALIIVFGTSLFVFANTSGFNQFRSHAISQLNVDQVELTIKGFVFGDGNPLIGAEVVVNIGGIEYIVYTGLNGEYKLEISDEYHGDIVVSFIYSGYKETTKEFNVKNGESSLFTGRVNLEKEAESCVKGKIAIDPDEEEENIPLPGIVVPDEEIEIQTKGEIIAPPETLKIIESSGGIKIDDGIKFD